MEPRALDQFDRLGESIDTLSGVGASANKPLDAFATPLDRIVTKFDDVSKSATTNAENFQARTKGEFKQLTGVMQTVGNEMRANWSAELGALASPLAGTYLDIQHTWKQMEGLSGRTDKTSRAERRRLQQSLAEQFKNFKNRYAGWKGSAYAVWQRDRDNAQKQKRGTVKELEGVRDGLRDLLADNPDDEELKELVSSLTNVKKALLSGNLRNIELPGGGKFDPKKGTFKEYVQKWKSAIEKKKGELKEEAEEEAEGEAEAEETVGAHGGAPEEAEAKKAAAIEAVAKPPLAIAPPIAMGGAAAPAKAAPARPEEKAPRPTRAERAGKEVSLDEIDREWTRLAEEAPATRGGEVAAEAKAVAPTPPLASGGAKAKAAPETPQELAKDWDEKLAGAVVETRKAIVTPKELDAPSSPAVESKTARIEQVRSQIGGLRQAITSHAAAAPGSLLADQAARYAKRTAKVEEAVTSYADMLKGRRTRAVMGPLGAVAPASRIERKEYEQAQGVLAAMISDTEKTLPKEAFEAAARGPEAAIFVPEREVGLPKAGSHLTDYQQDLTALIDTLEDNGRAKLDFKKKRSREYPEFQKDVDAKRAAMEGVRGDLAKLTEKVGRTYFPSGIIAGNADAERLVEQINLLQNAITGYQGNLEQLKIRTPALPGVDQIAIDTQTADALQTQLEQLTGNVRGAIGIPAAAPAGIPGALAAVAAAGVAGAVTAAETTAAAAAASLASLSAQAEQILTQIRSSAVRDVKGNMTIQKDARPPLLNNLRNVQSNIQRAVIAQPQNEQLKDLQFYLDWYASGIEHEDGALPADAQDLKVYGQWKSDAGLAAPGAPLPAELVVPVPPAAPVVTLAAAPAAVPAAAAGAPTTPPTIPPTLGEERRGAGERELQAAERAIAPVSPRTPGLRGPQPLPVRGAIGAGPLAAAMGLLALQRRDRLAQTAGAPEIPTLSGDTALGESSISPYGEAVGPTPVIGPGEIRPPSYAAPGEAVGPPMAGGDEGIGLTPGEEASRMRELERQKLETLRQFVGGPAAPMAAAVAAGAVAGAPEEVLPGEMPEEEEPEGPEDEEDRAMELDAQQRQSKIVERARQKGEEAIKKQIQKFQQQGAKAAGKATSTTARATLEGVEVASSPETIGLTLLALIVQLNLQLFFKYFLKFLKSASGGMGGEAGNKAFSCGEMFSQTFIEDIITVCIDCAICTNILFMPPMCFITFPIIIIVAVLGVGGLAGGGG